MQPLSRFALPYLLLKSGALKATGSLVNIAAPGSSAKTFDVADVELVRYNQSLQGAWFAPLRRIMASGDRDSVVLDAFHEVRQILSSSSDPRRSSAPATRSCGQRTASRASCDTIDAVLG